MTYGTRYLKGTRILNTRAPNPHSATYTAIFEISKIAKWASATLTTKYKPQDDPIKLSSTKSLAFHRTFVKKYLTNIYIACTMGKFFCKFFTSVNL